MGKLDRFAKSTNIAEALFPQPSSRDGSDFDQNSMGILASPPCVTPAPETPSCSEKVAARHRQYLWLTLSIDYSLHHGDLPSFVDFPKSLQTYAKATLVDADSS
jgi:hypothetical protein